MFCMNDAYDACNTCVRLMNCMCEYELYWWLVNFTLLFDFDFVASGQATCKFGGLMSV